MNMTTKLVKSLVKSSSLTPSVLGGEREEKEDYVEIDASTLQKALRLLDSKESKEEKVDAKTSRMSLGVGHATTDQDVRVKLVYDFEITPSTSAATAVATWQAVQVYPDSQTSSYLKYMWQLYRVEKAELTMDFHQYMNMVGVSDKIAAMGISYRKTTSTAIPGYTTISDDAFFKTVNWSQAKPVFKFQITPDMLKDVNFSTVNEMGSTQGVPVGKWSPLDRDMAMGYIHIATQDTFCAGTTGRKIICRLAVTVRLRSRI